MSTHELFCMRERAQGTPSPLSHITQDARDLMKDKKDLPDCLNGHRSDRFSCSHCAIASESDLIALSYVSNSPWQKDSSHFLRSGELLTVSCSGATMITTIGAASVKAASATTAGHTQPRYGECYLNGSCSLRLSPLIRT